MAASKGTATVQLNFRLPPELHARLVKLAAKERRSLNEQMVHLLERALTLSVIESEQVDLAMQAREIREFAEKAEKFYVTATEGGSGSVSGRKEGWSVNMKGGRK
jgi:hypothetical protein